MVELKQWVETLLEGVKIDRPCSFVHEYIYIYIPSCPCIHVVLCAQIAPFRRSVGGDDVVWFDVAVTVSLLTRIVRAGSGGLRGLRYCPTQTGGARLPGVTWCSVASGKGDGAGGMIGNDVNSPK